MMVTEAEAKTKDCPQPMVRLNIAPCRGSQCLAWRWVRGEITDRWEKPDGSKVWVTEAFIRATENAAETIHWKRVGYCGLGGRP
jgi:hypothetical protein